MFGFPFVEPEDRVKYVPLANLEGFHLPNPWSQLLQRRGFALRLFQYSDLAASQDQDDHPRPLGRSILVQQVAIWFGVRA